MAEDQLKLYRALRANGASLQGLRRYLDSGELPDLPVGYTDSGRGYPS